MVKTLTRLDKLRALRSVFKDRGMLAGGVADYMAKQFDGTLPPLLPWNGSSAPSCMGSVDTSDGEDKGSGDTYDTEPVSGPKRETNIWLAARYSKC
jgi:hypothetical protein